MIMRKSFRFYHRQDGGHTWVRVFAGDIDRQHGKCGELIMTNEEFEAFRIAIENGSGGVGMPLIEFRSGAEILRREEEEKVRA